MAALSDDDVPTMASVDDLRRGIAQDGDTASASEPPSNDADEEDRTVQQAVGPHLRASSPDHGTEASLEPPVTPVTPKRESDPVKKGEPPSPPRPRVAPPPSSRKMTAVGLGAPPPATRPTAQAEPPKNATPPPIESIDDENDITATAPAPKISVPKLPIAPVGAVEIRTIEEDDEADATEVRTIPGNIRQIGTPSAPLTKTPITPAAGAAPPPPAPASAPVSADPDTARVPADEPDDSVTTEAPAPNVPSNTPPIDDPNVIRISPKSIMPSAAASAAPSTDPVSTRRRNVEPKAAPGVSGSKPPDEYFDDDEESVTTKGPTVDGSYSMGIAGADFVDDSVTAQAPLTRVSGHRGDLPPAIEDGTEGTTQKLRKNKTAATKQSPIMPAASASPLPADEEGDSVTAQAPPGQFANMLRIAAATPAPVEEEEDDPYNRTAVMANAPMKPPATPRTTNGARAAAAPRLEPSSESGLRVARESMSGSGERASFGQLVAEPRPSGIAPTGEARLPRDSGERRDPSAFAKTEQAFPPPPGGPQLSLHEVDFRANRPHYGLLVGIVAAFSVGIPLILFLALNQSGGDSPPRVAAQPSPDPVTRGDPTRAKFTKGQHNQNQTPPGSGSRQQSSTPIRKPR